MGNESGGGTSRALSSAPTRSRASSRSTIVPRSDTDHPPATVDRTRHRSTDHDDTDVNPGRPGSKRPRSPEGQGGTEPPPKRIRLRQSSTRTLQAVTLHCIIFSLFSPYHRRPVRNSRPSLRKFPLPQRQGHLSNSGRQVRWVGSNL